MKGLIAGGRLEFCFFIFIGSDYVSNAVFLIAGVQPFRLGILENERVLGVESSTVFYVYR